MSNETSKNELFNSLSYKNRASDEPIYLDERSINTAVSVYTFLMTRSYSEQHFIFRQVVKDMLSYSLSFTEDEVIDQLSASIVKNKLNSGDDDKLKLIYDCFSSRKSYDKEKQFLDALHTGNVEFINSVIYTLPSAEEIFKVFKAFQPKVEDFEEDVIEAKKKELKNKTTIRVKKINEKGLNTRNWQDTSWCFAPFGYLSVFENWLAFKGENNPYEYYFYNLYFRGKVMDFVLETIFQCDASSIRHRLLKALEKESFDNEAFSLCLNDRYAYYRKIHPEIPEKHFDYCPKNDDDKDKKTTVQALPPFIKTEKLYATDEKLGKMWSDYNGIYFRCGRPVFIKLFSGSYTGTITWVGSVNELAGFLKAFSFIAYGGNHANICTLALRIFTVQKKDGTILKPSIHSLKKYKQENVDMFSDLLKNYLQDNK